MTMHATDEELILRYYGELASAERRRVDEHIAGCETCRASDARLRQVMTVVDTAEVPEPSADYEREVWSRVQARLPEARRCLSEPNWWPAWSPRPKTRPTWSLWSPAGLGAAAAVAVFVVVSFVAGRYWRAPAAPTDAPVVAPSVGSPQVARDRILLVAVGDHLGQTEMVLVELANAGDGRLVDISTARAQAADLVAASRLYRQTALSTGDAAMANVLEEIERALIEIARSPAEVSPHELADMLRGIQAQNLLFKLRVVSEQVREREESAGALPARAVS